MLVQRGTYYNGGSYTSTISIPTPVPVGKSFVFVTLSDSKSYDNSSYSVRAILKTVVNDEYTQIEFEQPSSQNRAYIHWQVVSGDEFSVQMITENNMTSNSTTKSISAVDLDKTFLVLNWANIFFSDYAEGAVLGAKLNSTTEVGFTRGASAGPMKFACYVVEWDGATVKSGQFKMDRSDYATDPQKEWEKSITQIDLSKSFLIFNYYLSDGNCVNRISQWMVRGRIINNTTLGFRVGYGNNNSVSQNVSYFVVSHDDIKVQDLSGSFTGTDESWSLSGDDQIADLDTAFIPTGMTIGNAYNDLSDYSLQNGASRRWIDSVTTVKANRGGSSETLYVQMFLVESLPPRSRRRAAFMKFF